MNFTEDVLERFPAAQPALLAISADRQRTIWHFGELIARSAGISGALAARGVRRGEVVMCLIGDRIELVLTMLACWRMGAVVMPCGTELDAAEIERRRGLARPRICVGEDRPLRRLAGEAERLTIEDFWDALDEDRPQEWPVEPAALGPQDPAAIAFAADRGNGPAALIQPQRSLPGRRLAGEGLLGGRERDLIWWPGAAAGSGFAGDAFVSAWLCGAAALIHDAPLDPQARIEIAGDEGVGVLVQSTADYEAIAATAALAPLPALRRALTSDLAPLSAGAAERWATTVGTTIHRSVAPAETGPLFGYDEDLPSGPVGPPLAPIAVQLEGDETRGGELWVEASSCPAFFAGTLEDDGSVSAPALVGGRWWPTGIAARRDAEGRIWPLGPIDDLISAADGSVISPLEVESVLIAHEAVAAAAVVAWPDRQRGKVARAVVVTAAGQAHTGELAAELRDHVRRELGSESQPRIVEFADELPRGTGGELLRAALRTDAASGLAAQR